MSKKLAVNENIEQAMLDLGKKIKACRGERSLRKIAEPSEISASQLLSIENGVLAPTAEIYPKLIKALHPSNRQNKEMDKLYMAIRKAPPPDVCEFIIEHQELVSALRSVKNTRLTKKQLNKIITLLASFAQENVEGDT